MNSVRLMAAAQFSSITKQIPITETELDAEYEKFIPMKHGERQRRKTSTSTRNVSCRTSLQWVVLHLLSASATCATPRCCRWRSAGRRRRARCSLLARSYYGHTKTNEDQQQNCPLSVEDFERQARNAYLLLFSRNSASTHHHAILELPPTTIRVEDVHNQDMDASTARSTRWGSVLRQGVKFWFGRSCSHSVQTDRITKVWHHFCCLNACP